MYHYLWYAGIENDRFFRPKTSMLFGDAKKVLHDLITEIKNVQQVIFTKKS